MLQSTPRTETDIRKLKPVEKEQFYGFGNGLNLRHSAPHRLTWVYRTKVGGKQQKIKLGTWPAMSLASARAAAAALATKPVMDQTRASTVMDEWYERVVLQTYKRPQNAVGYVARFKRQFGHRMIGSISTAELTNSLIAYAKQTPVAANRCRAHWRLMFSYAKQRGLVAINPLAESTNAVSGGVERPRQRVLDDTEIRWVMNVSDKYGPVLRFMLLTGLRIGEALAATTEHLDGDTLHIPETKSDRAHWVHITPLAKKQLGDFGGRLFAMRAVTAVQTKVRDTGMGWTPHDLRRTFATRLAGMSVALHVVEKSLNHSLGGILATYNVHDYGTDRIQACQQWADVLQGYVEAQ